MPKPAVAGARTEREELHELEALYRNTPVGLCVVDRELSYIRANEEYARTVGYSVDDLIGRSMWDVIPDSARSGAVEVARRTIETGEPVLGTELRRHVPEDPSKDIIWLVNVHPVTANGEVVGAMAVLQNVTTVRQAEEAAAASLRELESIYGHAPVGLSFIDTDLRYLRVNQAIADMNGLSVEEMVGKRYRDISPDTADTAEPFLRGLMERGEPVRNLEVRSATPVAPGVERVFLLSLDPVVGAAGDIVGYTSAVLDITEHREAEAEAARRLAELEILYEHTPVALCHLDAELRAIHLNPLFAQLAGMSEEVRIGASIDTLLPQPIADQLLPQFRSVVRTCGASAPLEVRGTPPGADTEVTWIARAHPILSRDGALGGVIAVMQDITSQVARRREVEAVRDRLAEAQRVSQVGSWEWNLVDDELWWSPEQYEIFGEPESRVPSYVDFIEHVHPSDRPKIRAQLERTLEDDQPTTHITFQISRADGVPRVLFSAMRLERAPGGQPLRLVGTCQDVTEFSPLHEVFGKE